MPLVLSTSVPSIESIDAERDAIMATTQYQIDASYIGQAIGPPNGAIVLLRMSTAPVYETPCWDEGAQKWVSGCLTLRGTGDIRDTICIAPATNGGALSGGIMISSNNGSVAYSGALQVVAVPKGSSWSVTLSDASGG
jgi:hypothetical protein